MRGSVAKQLNKLAKLLDLSRGERTKLKRDWTKTPNRSLKDLKERIARVESTVDSVGQ